jgi:hypothetical protein
MAVHYVVLNRVKQIVNPTDDRRRILQFFGSTCRQYYLLCCVENASEFGMCQSKVRNVGQKIRCYLIVIPYLDRMS